MSTLSEQPVGTRADGRPIRLFTLGNDAGMLAKIITYGAIHTELHVPDRRGVTADVALGCADLAGYLGKHPYFGATIGRVANRIARGRFALGGTTYRLAINNGPNHLHGGIVGFDKVVWDAEAVRSGGEVGVRLSHTSRDGDEGYPGTLSVSVTYTLTDANELRIVYAASTDRTTVVNLTNHSYFNLGGHDSGSILDHILTLTASRYTPVDADLIPTGEIASVVDTPFDFRAPRRIGESITAVGGYDHNWVLDQSAPGALSACARLTDPRSGRIMDVLTTEPGVQFYTGNFLDGTDRGKNGCAYARHAGLCLETQHFPDSPNHPSFPGITLEPSQRYAQTTAYHFSAR